MYYTLIPILVTIAKIKYGLRTDRSALRGKKGPFLVLGNHTSPIDFLFFSGCVFPKPLNYVVAQNMYYRNFYHMILTMFHTIPKQQFAADYNCIKQIKRYLDNKTSVLIFPEGRVTPDGTTGYIAPSIGKLVKWLGYPVISGITKGGYVSNPKWGRKRTSKVRLKMEEILSKEDIAKMSADEIATFITEKLQYNDNLSQIEDGRRINGYRIAEGLECLLYKCPKCGAECENVTELKELSCKVCGNSVSYNNEGTITANKEGDVAFERIDLWFSYQRDCVKKEVGEDGFELSDKVKLCMINEKEHLFNEVGVGIVRLNKDGIFYSGSKDGETFEISFALDNLPTVAYRIGYDFEVTERGVIYRFEFTERNISTKYSLAIEELYKKYCE
jgi:1-acyl-sn-glycerol-3-phosphate acyltransferase